MTKHTIAGSRENTFDEQNESDPIIEDLEVSINSLREELNLFASLRPVTSFNGIQSPWNDVDLVVGEIGKCVDR